MKNILLTGSGGFIGSHLKNSLINTYNLFCPRSSELNLLDKNLVTTYLKNNKIDFIIHSASCGVRTNINQSINDVTIPNLVMFNNLANSEIPMITIGSGAEYDKSKNICYAKETDFGKSIPKDAYGYAKYLISKEIENKDNILNLRVFGIYGIGEDASRVTSCIVNAKKNNIPVEFNQNVRFHFIWIEDFCKIVKYFIDNPTQEKFINVAPTESIEIINMAKLLNVQYKLKKDGLNKEYTADNSLLRKKLGNFEFTNYEIGLNKYYEIITQKQ